MMSTLTVSQLNRYVRMQLEHDEKLQNLRVQGEISNCKCYGSGHIYFTLQDLETDCAVSAVMYKSSAQYLRFIPKNGMCVLVTGRAMFYEKKGEFQLCVVSMAEFKNAGQHAQSLEQLKKKLLSLGIFDPSAKRPLPAMPQDIGVVTSAYGAAYQDIRKTLEERYPIGHLHLYPAVVQGEQAPASICRAIRAAERGGCDVIIVGRGGGSAEDLAAFQTEEVVMAIYGCAVPVISAVGHETDWTLSDEAADARASTPTKAAVMATPDMPTLRTGVMQYTRRLQSAMEKQLREKQTVLTHCTDRLHLQAPARQVERAQYQLKTTVGHLQDVLQAKYFVSKQAQLQSAAQRLELLNPMKILGQGYGLVYHGETLLRRADQVQSGDVIHVKLEHGALDAQVQNIEMDDASKI